MTTPREQARAELERIVSERVGPYFFDGRRAMGDKLTASLVNALLDPSNRSKVLGAMGGVLLSHDMQCWTEDRGQMRGSAYVFPKDTERSEASNDSRAEA